MYDFEVEPDENWLAYLALQKEGLPRNITVVAFANGELIAKGRNEDAVRTRANRILKERGGGVDLMVTTINVPNRRLQIRGPRLY